LDERRPALAVGWISCHRTRDRRGGDVQGQGVAQAAPHLAAVNVDELFGCEPLSRWVDDPATIQADEPGDLRGLQVDAAPGEFVAVVGTSAAVEVVANDLIRAPITSAAP
jgi:hypothetical protein